MLEQTAGLLNPSSNIAGLDSSATDSINFSSPQALELETEQARIFDERVLARSANSLRIENYSIYSQGNTAGMLSLFVGSPNQQGENQSATDLAQASSSNADIQQALVSEESTQQSNFKSTDPALTIWTNSESNSLSTIKFILLITLGGGLSVAAIMGLLTWRGRNLN